ncbi:hypothetical protein ACJMK2_016010, partial [Sinanodonta woodiana]
FSRKSKKTLQPPRTCSTLQANTKSNQHQLTAFKMENATHQLKRRTKREFVMTCQLKNAFRTRSYQANAEQLHVILLKDPETGYFTRKRVKCVIELIGEKESATRCADVTETMCKHLLDIHLTPACFKLCRKGYGISKFQLADAVLKSEHSDIHTDGTTKCGKKGVGQQVTLDSGASVACVFSVIATSTLVAIATNLLQELRDGCQNKGEKKILCGVSSVKPVQLSDQAVMKGTPAQMHGWHITHSRA